MSVDPWSEWLHPQSPLGRHLRETEHARSDASSRLTTAVERGNESLATLSERAAMLETIAAAVFAEQAHASETLDSILHVLSNPSEAAAGEHIRRGVRAFHEGWLDDAADELSRAIELDRYIAIAHFYLGLTRERSGDPERARISHRNAIKYERTNPALAASAAIRLIALGEAQLADHLRALPKETEWCAELSLARVVATGDPGLLPAMLELAPELGVDAHVIGVAEADEAIGDFFASSETYALAARLADAASELRRRGVTLVVRDQDEFDLSSLPPAGRLRAAGSLLSGANDIGRSAVEMRRLRGSAREIAVRAEIAGVEAERARIRAELASARITQAQTRKRVDELEGAVRTAESAVRAFARDAELQSITHQIEELIATLRWACTLFRDDSTGVIYQLTGNPWAGLAYGESRELALESVLSSGQSRIAQAITNSPLYGPYRLGKPEVRRWQRAAVRRLIEGKPTVSEQEVRRRCLAALGVDPTAPARLGRGESTMDQIASWVARACNHWEKLQNASRELLMERSRHGMASRFAAPGEQDGEAARRRAEEAARALETAGVESVAAERLVSELVVAVAREEAALDDRIAQARREEPEAAAREAHIEDLLSRIVAASASLTQIAARRIRPFVA